MSNKKFNVGDKVKYIGLEHDINPQWFPIVGTIGTVVQDVDEVDCYIQWPKESTSKEDRWYCNKNDIELVENEDMTNEEIWKMIENKMQKNGFHYSLVYDKNNVEYETCYKGRPFKIGEKKKKCGHWEPVDPNNLPKEGTRVRYNKNKEIFGFRDGTTGIVSNNKFGFNIRLDNRNLEFLGHAKDAVAFDMWVEDDE